MRRHELRRIDELLNRERQRDKLLIARLSRDGIFLKQARSKNNLLNQKHIHTAQDCKAEQLDRPLSIQHLREQTDSQSDIVCDRPDPAQQVLSLAIRVLGKALEKLGMVTLEVESRDKAAVLKHLSETNQWLDRQDNQRERFGHALKQFQRQMQAIGQAERQVLNELKGGMGDSMTEQLIHIEGSEPDLDLE